MSNPDFLGNLYDIVFISLLAILCLLTVLSLRKLKIPRFISVALCIFAIVVMGFIPPDAAVATDRSRYISLFLYGQIRSITDSGFLIFVSICSRLLGSNYVLFFLFVATLYILGYYSFAKRVCPEVFVPVLVICILSSFGFLTYNVNTMRSGLGLSVFLLGTSYYLREKKVLSYVLFVLSGFIHFSLFAVVGAFFVSQYSINLKWYYLFWFICMALSIIDIAKPLTDLIETLDNEKMMRYMTEDISYKAGFRIDFIAYSLIPIIVGGWYIYRKKYNEERYLMLYRIYLLVNGIWLLFIRIPYTDRVAYLSWFLFPFILVLPTFDKRIHPIVQGGVFFILLLIKVVL